VDVDSSDCASLEEDMSSSSPPFSISGFVLPDPHHDAEPHTPRRQYEAPTSTLATPRLRKRTEDRRTKGCKDGIAASSDASVGVNHASMVKHRRGRHSAPDSAEVEAARRRGAAQRREQAMKACVEQEKKRASLEAWVLRQRAADLEREAEEEEARLIGEVEMMEEEEEEEGEGEEEEDSDEVVSNYSYAPTEVYSAAEQECWTRPSPFKTQQQRRGGHGLHRHDAVMVHPQVTTSEPYVVVTRMVNDLNTVTGSSVQRTKRYRVRIDDLESLQGSSDMDEL
jgi:hypothetical protein